MKRNLSSYFFKKSWAHYSFGQMLVSGVLALAIAGSTISGSVYAASVLQTASSPDSSSASQPAVTATPAPIATLEPIINTELLELEWYASTVGDYVAPIPDIEVVLSTGGSQQVLSVGVYAEMQDENGYTWNEILVGVPIEITIVCDSLAQIEHEENITGHSASVVGAISVYDINTSTGVFQMGEIDPGEYNVSISCDVEGYIMPDPVTVTVVEKVVYEVDDEIEMEEEDAGFEDEGVVDDTVIEDTVRYVDSSYTSKDYTMYVLSSGDYWTSGTNKYFYYADGKKSPYKITTATTTINGVSYEYYTTATVDTTLSVDSYGVVIESTSSSSASSSASSVASTTSATSSGGVSYAAVSNASFSGLEPLSVSVGSGASSGEAYSASSAKTLSTAVTKTLVVSSDTTNYGSFMTIEDESSTANTTSSGSESATQSTSEPTAAPTASPAPSPSPTASPTPVATQAPTTAPTETPAETLAPTQVPTTAPTDEPTTAPTDVPTVAPTDEPTVAPTEAPTQVPTAEPTATPVPSAATMTASLTLYSNGAANNASASINGTSYTVNALFGISVKTVTEYTYSGWQTIGSAKYYYDPDTNKPVTGTQVINGTTYLFSVTGAYDSQCTGIDVSYWQGSIDWDKVKAAGVEFVIIRAGYRGYSSGTIVQDVNFTTYINGATAAGLRVGIYFFSQAINAQEGVEEASACINLIKSYGTSYPIYIDTELSGASGNVGRADNISNADRTAAVVAFCETIKSAGYTPGIYASYSWFTSKLNFSEISGYSLWNAQWGTTNSLSSAGMWQYTSDGAVSGISGRVDMNISYIG